jgi:hypothetical protein
MTLPTKEIISIALKNAGNAHHDYETVILKGVKDQNWSGFYAAFLLGHIGPIMEASKLSLLLEEVALSDKWSEDAALLILSRLNE